MAYILIHFSHQASANCPIAGIPAAARAVREVMLTTARDPRIDGCIVAVPGGWVPSRWCKAEFERLVSDFNLDLRDSNGVEAEEFSIALRGEELLQAPVILQILAEPPGSGTASMPWPLSEARSRETLSAKEPAIIRSTAKTGDGLVSRYLNRPLSQAVSRILLRFPGIRPLHATIAAALIGIAMFAALVSGTDSGLVAGAVLFQLASIIDGVDGEIARSTYRASRRGAMLDSLTDACTNLGFFAGVGLNLFLQGHTWAAAAGGLGLAVLATGLFVIGYKARTAGAEFTFNGVKERLTARPARWRQWLVWLTMRDFYAAAAAASVIVGLAGPMLFAFAIAATAWLIVSMFILVRSP